MKRLQPALLGGLLIGVLSSLPVVSICCCLWVLLGGALTVYLQQQRQPEPIEAADAVLGGLLAGLFGGIIAAVAASVMFSISGVVPTEEIRNQLEQNPEIPAQTREMILNLLQGRSIVVLIFLFNLICYPVIAMLGGLIGLAIFKKKVPPAPAG
jgi:hypothetical protein